MNGFNNLVRMFGKIVGDTDKMPQDMQIATGMELINKGYHTILKDVNKSLEYCKRNKLDIVENTFEIANLSQAVCDTLEGKSTGYLAKLDTKQSILLIQSCILRDEDALKLLLSNEDVYALFMNKLNMEGLTRKKTKKVVIPRGYGSEKGVITKFKSWGNEKKAYEFFELYAKTLPKCDKFRQIMLDCWQWAKTDYHWLTPDMGECNQAVQEDQPENGWVELCSTFEWITPNKGNCHEKIYIPHKGPKPFGKKGTRSLGANCTHSLDGYTLRETERRCSQADRYMVAWFQLGKPTQDGNVFCKDPKVEKFYKFWKKTNIATLRVLEFVSEGDNLPSDYYNAIGKNVSRLPEHRFDLYFTVHDEFACHINYADDMQKQFNYIMSEIYQGTYLEYIKEAFEWETARWLKPDMENIELSAINPKTVEAIENSTVIFQ